MKNNNPYNIKEGNLAVLDETKIVQVVSFQHNDMYCTVKLINDNNIINRTMTRRLLPYVTKKQTEMNIIKFMSYLFLIVMFIVVYPVIHLHFFGESYLELCKNSIYITFCAIVFLKRKKFTEWTIINSPNLDRPESLEKIYLDA